MAVDLLQKMARELRHDYPVELGDEPLEAIEQALLEYLRRDVREQPDWWRRLAYKALWNVDDPELQQIGYRAAAWFRKLDEEEPS